MLFMQVNLEMYWSLLGGWGKFQGCTLVHPSAACETCLLTSLQDMGPPKSIQNFEQVRKWRKLGFGQAHTCFFKHNLVMTYLHFH